MPICKNPCYLSLTEYKNKLERLSRISQMLPSCVSYWPYRKHYTRKVLKGRQKTLAYSRNRKLERKLFCWIFTW
jgi:hypothetical protein